MKYIFFLLFITADIALARGNYSLFEVEKLDIKHSQMAEASRDPYAMQYTGQWYTKSELEWRINMLKFIYLDNNMHMEMIDPVTVKTVGWRHELGIRILDSVSLFWGHHSRHVLDEPGMFDPYITESHFPVEDHIGIRIRIIKEKTGRALFR